MDRRAGPVTSPLLVGRDEELRALVSCVMRPAATTPRVALVSGRSGMGKTRLVDEASIHLTAHGVRVLRGAGLPFGSEGPPYVPLLHALRPALSPEAPLLKGLAGILAMGRPELFGLALDVVQGLAQDAPLVLVIDDLHWLDTATTDVLTYLLTEPAGTGWTFLATRRLEDSASPGGARLVELLFSRPLAHVGLESLDTTTVAQQIAAITGDQPTAEAAELVHRRSGGIPLLVEEVVASGTDGVPAHLRSLFLARVRALGADVFDAVAATAMFDHGCDEEQVAAVLRIDVARALTALDAAVAADQLNIDALGYHVRHDLLREVVYDALAPGRRRDLHARVAQVLDDRGAPPDELARHWYRAGVLDRAALASVAAATSAERSHAPAAAHAHLERALEVRPALAPGILTRLPGKAELLQRAAAAAERNGSFARAIHLAQQLIHEEPAAPGQAARRWSRLAAYRLGAGDGQGAIGAFEQALHLLPAVTDPLVRADVLAGYARFLGFTADTARARQLADEARRIPLDDPLGRCRVLLAWGQAHAHEERGWDALSQARDLAVALDAGQEVAISHACLGLCLDLQGRILEREPVLRAGLRHVASHGLGGGVQAVLEYQLAGLLLDLGRWDEADAILVSIRSRGVAGIARYFASGYAARLAAGRAGRNVDALLAECRLLGDALPQQPLPLCLALLAASEVELWSGRPERAAELATEAWQHRGIDEVSMAEVVAVSAQAWADLTVSRSPAAATASSQLTSRLAESADTLSLAAHPRIHALLLSVTAERGRGRGVREPDEWREVVSAWTRTGDPYRAACAQWRLAWALLGSRTGRTEAAHLLNEAASTALRLGARQLGAAVADLAGRSRVRLGGAPAPLAQFGLSPRELEVLPLLVQGRTNPEIAAVLWLSPRTVGVHVSRILQKLGAARRTEAADIARRAGLVR